MPPPPLPRPPPPPSQESPSSSPDFSLPRDFSGDFGGGGFGSDGTGILQKECSRYSGGSGRGPGGAGQRQQLRSQASRPRPVDVEKLGGDLQGNGVVVVGGGGSEFVVSWVNGDDDSENPKAMSNTRKWICTCVVSLSSLCVTCTSSIYSSTYAQITDAFHAPRLLAIAGLSLFVMGLGIGPMFLAPLSEFYGRRPIYLVSFSIFTLFLIPCALAPNIAVLLVFRFLTGFAGSAFLSVAGGTVGDMFVPSQLGAPMMIYTASPFIGPELGPLIGGFVNQNVDWRWTFWIVMIWSVGNLVGLLFLVPETYHPVLLRHRAERIRRETGEERYRAPIEMLERSIPRTVLLSAKRPFELLLFEPMLLMLCLFSAILLGILYLFFEAFPLVFSTVHNFTLDKIGLTFLGLFVGMVLGILSDPLWTRIYHTLSLKNGSNPQPEFRLPPVMAGSLLVPIGLFWFAWTTYRSIHWIVPIIGSSVFALGLLLVFSGVFTFLVEAYPVYAASALAANSFVRSAAAAGFPLFSEGMYKHLGFQWATALLGFLAGGMAPFAFLFFKYGEKIRTKSRYATSRAPPPVTFP